MSRARATSSLSPPPCGLKQQGVAPVGELGIQVLTAGIRLQPDAAGQAEAAQSGVEGAGVEIARRQIQAELALTPGSRSRQTPAPAQVHSEIVQGQGLRAALEAARQPDEGQSPAVQAARPAIGHLQPPLHPALAIGGKLGTCRQFRARPTRPPAGGIDALGLQDDRLQGEWIEGRDHGPQIQALGQGRGQGELQAGETARGLCSDLLVPGLHEAQPSAQGIGLGFFQFQLAATLAPVTSQGDEPEPVALSRLV